MVKWNVIVEKHRHPAPDRKNINEKKVESEPRDDKEGAKHKGARRPSGREHLKQQKGREEVKNKPNADDAFSLSDKVRKVLMRHDPEEKKGEERHINYGEFGIEIPHRALLLGI